MDEFVQRRIRLAQALVADKLDAFVAETGHTFKYYANVSQPEWEVWEPEERPFLMIVQPHRNETTGEIFPITTFLAPYFELERARLLKMPFDDTPKFLPWKEHWNPYTVLRSSWKFYSTRENQTDNNEPKIMVDDEIRDFIQRGLGENGFEVVGLGGEVERVKQTKSSREIQIIRGVNTGRVEAVRATELQ